MCNDLNRVTLSGRVGNVDVKNVTVNGTVVKVASFTLIINQGKDRDPSYVKIEKWDAEYIYPYLVKGKKVIIEGKLKLKQWRESVGAEDVPRSFLMVVSDRIYFND